MKPDDNNPTTPSRRIITPLNEESILEELSTQDNTNQHQPTDNPTNAETIREPEVTAYELNSTPVYKPVVDLAPENNRKRFPWIRTILCGAGISSLHILLTIYLLRFATLTDNSFFIGLVILHAAPIRIVISSIIAGLLLKLLGLERPFMLALGTTILSHGFFLLYSTMTSTPLGLPWGFNDNPWTIVANYAVLLLPVLIPLMGAVSISLLALLTNIFRDRLSTPAVVFGWILLVAMPFMINAGVTHLKSTSFEESLSQQDNNPQSAVDRQTNSSKLTPDNAKRLLMPTRDYSPYDAAKLERCLGTVLIVAGVRDCHMKCLQEIDGYCADVDISSGRLFDEHEPYLYKDGKCDSFSLPAVMNNVATRQAMPTITKRDCDVFTTPGGKKFYASVIRDINNILLIDGYIAEDGSLAKVSLRIDRYPSGDTDLTENDLEKAQGDFLGFIDTLTIYQH